MTVCFGKLQKTLRVVDVYAAEMYWLDSLGKMSTAEFVEKNWGHLDSGHWREIGKSSERKDAENQLIHP